MASQQDIAKRLKITQATVSRALRNDQALPLETILKVKKMAQKLHYKPQIHRKKAIFDYEINKSRRLLVVVSGGKAELHNSTTQEFLQGLIDATNEKKIELIVKPINSIIGVNELIKKYSNYNLGCLAIFKFEEEIINLLNKNFHLLSINHYYERLQVKSIEVNQELAFTQMYQTLYEYGHRKIGFLTIQNSNALIFRRFAGFLNGSISSKNTVSDHWVVNIGQNSPTVPDHDLVDYIIKLYREEHVTAFLCSSGDLAQILMPKLLKRGIRIPDDISLGGFDELVVSAVPNMQLYGATANYKEFAYSAINIFQNFDNFPNISSFVLTPQFQYGNTIKNLNIATDN